MTDITNTLTVDEAMAEFMKVAEEQLGCLPPIAGPYAAPPATFEEAEAQRFRLAERILSLACPDPTACKEPRCRRERQCTHFANMRALRPTHPRRPPGAAAVRYAVWVFMNRQPG